MVGRIEGWKGLLGSAMLRVAVPLALTVAVDLLADASSRLLGGFSGIGVDFAMGLDCWTVSSPRLCLSLLVLGLSAKSDSGYN